jgi:carboxypeptidase family protein
MTFNSLRLGVRCLALLILAACVSSIALNAQSTTQGSIAGSVLDSSDAAIPGATVHIQNVATGFAVDLVTDSSGYFKEPLLEPGKYAVSIASPNFAKYRADDVVVVVDQVTSLEPRLAVSSSSTQVVVTEQTPVMNLESPDFNDTLNGRAMQNVPINNRRWSALALSTPGVTVDTSGYGLISVHGISTLLNNVEIDGADDNQAYFAEERGRTREAYSTSGSAVREFVMNTGVYSAEFGRAAGGVVNSVTKSGTNQIHGQAYFFDKESNWNAYNDYTTITKLVNGKNVTSHFKPEDLRKIYGFTAGGPIFKNKLFWIYTYDQHTHVFPEVGIPSSPANFFTLPDATLPAGATCAANGYLSGAPASASFNDTNACGLAARQGISYVQASYDWAALFYGTANVTAGNYPGAVTISDPGLNTDLGLSPRFGFQEINTPKVDWQINDKEHLSVLAHRLRWDSPGGVQSAAAINYAKDTEGNDFVKLDYGIAKLTSLITSNISNEVLYQYGRELDDENQQPYTDYTKADLTPYGIGGNVPEVILSGSTAYGVNIGSPYYSYRVAYPYETKWQVGDILYWTKSNHSFKFGIDTVHNYDLENNLFRSNGYITYNYLPTYFNDLLNYKNGVTPSAANNRGCNSSASENATTAGATIVGKYPCYKTDSQGFGNPTFQLSTLDFGAYGQDNWKITPQLTLEFGLRWDHETIPGPSPNLLTAAGAFTPFAQLSNTPSDWMNFGPRVGFSFDVFKTGNTVLRGGYGIYYGRITNGNIENVRVGTGSPNGQIDPSFTPATAGAPFFPYLAGAGSATPTGYFFSNNLKLPEVQEFDLMVQQAVGRGTVFQVSYLGSLGRELPNFLMVNWNPATVTPVNVTISDASNSGPLGRNGTIIPGVGQYTSYGNTALFGATANSFSTITEMVSNVNSNYNAMVAEVLNRSLKNIQFDASYTWSHALDFSQNADTQGAQYGAWYDPYSSAKLNYGDSQWNIPNHFVATVIYNFPGVNGASPLKWVANDWSADTSFSMANGFPFTGGATGFFSAGLQSDWNGASGSTVIPGIGYNTFRMPRDIVDDFRLSKQINFEHGYGVELIANVFNLANHQNITGMNTSLYSLSGTTATYLNQSAAPNNTFRQVTATNGSNFTFSPRQVEIAARVNF